MKLECSVVKDLYVLYEENELSPEVKQAVEDHLKDCPHCRSIYENEQGFEDIIKKDTYEEPSKKLDEKLKLKLKIRRLRAAVILIVIILISTMYNNYYYKRQAIHFDIGRIEQSLYHISHITKDIKSDYFSYDINEKIRTMQHYNYITNRDLNFIEKKAVDESNLGLFIDYRFENLIKLLHNRYVNGIWYDKDEKAYNLLNEYIDDTIKLLEQENEKLNKLHNFNKLDALFNPIKIEELCNNYYKLHQLALIYTQYNKLPNEIQPLSVSNIESIVKKSLMLDNFECVINTESMNRDTDLNGFFKFDVIEYDDKENYKYKYSISMDSYTGNIVRINSNDIKTDGERLAVNHVKNNLLNFFKNQYNDDYTFEIDYAGINKNCSDNVGGKYYCFYVTPIYKNFKLDTKIIADFDARSGMVHWCESFGNTSSINSTFDFVDTEIKISPKEAFNNLKFEDDDDEIKKENFIYSETIIIYSPLKNKYILVHKYEYHDSEKTYSPIYINASNGKREYTNY